MNTSSISRSSLAGSRRALRIGLLGSISCAALAAGFAAPTPALAQTTTASTDGGIEEVIVTARKKSEDIQSVPLSIKALTAADLEAAGVQDLRDVTFQTPGLTFNEGAGANSFSKPIIRGQTDLSSNPDNNVPVFFDGVYVSNTSSIDFGLIDLARIEVIKGPVSATYGRSAYAGAINYVSALPGDEWSGYAEVTGGDYNKLNVRGGVSGPITDTLKGGISASYDTFEGTYHDNTTGENANGYRKRDALLDFDWTPTSNLEIRPVVYYGNDKFDPAATIYGPANCAVGAYYGYGQTYCGKVPGNDYTDPTEHFTKKPQIADDGQYGATGNRRQVLLANLQATLSVDGGTFTSLTGYGHYITNEYVEFDDAYGITADTYILPPTAQVGGHGAGGTATGDTVTLPLLFGYTNDNVDTSEELRFTSLQDQPLRFSVGGYYASTHIYQDLQLAQETCAVPAGDYVSIQGGDAFAAPCGQNFSNQKSAFRLSNTIYAEFASADWDILPNLTLSTEIRETEEIASYKDLYAIYTPSPYSGVYYSSTPASTPCPLGKTAGGGCVTFKKDFPSFTSRSSLSYKPTEGVMVYVTAANGDKSGGFNNNATYQTYNPEKNWTYEAGIKTTLLDDHLQLNGDIFSIQAKNYQIYGPPPGSKVPGGFITTNYGSLSTKGGEISADYAVDENVSLEAGAAYADPKFGSDAFAFGGSTVAQCEAIPSCDPTGTAPTPGHPSGRLVDILVPGSNPPAYNEAVSLKGFTPPYVSKFTFNTALQLRFPIWNDWFWTGRVDYRFESKQFYQYPEDYGYFGPKNIVNLRTGIESDVWSAVVFVRNLTNDKTPVTVQDAAATGAQNFQAGYFPVAVLPDGRTYGITLKYKF